MEQVTILQHLEKEEHVQNIEFLKYMAASGHSVVIISKFAIKYIEKDFDYYVMKEEETLVQSLNNLIEAGANGDVLFLNSTVSLNDESYQKMHQCIYSFEKYGVVSPNDLIETDSDMEKLSELFPRYSRKTLVNEECFLIKGGLIDNFGKFNIAYKSVEFALKDFIERINNFGYQYMCANYAFTKRQSSNLKDSGNEARDGNLFYSTYDYALKLEAFKNEHTQQAVERFWPLIKNMDSRKKKILFECQNMPAFYNGTSEHQLSLFGAFYSLFTDKYDIYICVNRDADSFHKISERYDCVIYPDSISDIFDLGFSVTQPFSLEQQFFLNQYCLKIVYNVLDSIILRCNAHIRHNFEIRNVARLGVRLCDGLTTISEFSKDDFKHFFEEDGYSIKKPIKRIYNASDFVINKTTCNLNIPFPNYFLIVGNSLKHKAIKETINELKESGRSFIVLGQENEGYASDNIYTYPSGYLQEPDLAYLYANCDAVIFPSFYEGFGLPILIAIKNQKKIFLLDNELNRELQQYLSGFFNTFVFFKRLGDINTLIETIDLNSSDGYGEYNYSWRDVAEQIEQFFDEILNLKVNPEELEERWDLFNYMQRNVRGAKRDPQSWTSILLEDLKYKKPNLYKFLKDIYLFKKHFVADGKINEQKIAKPVTADGIKIMGEIVSNIDKVEAYKHQAKRYIYISGWAFERNLDVKHCRIYVALNGKDYYDSFEVYRGDVIEHYNEIQNIKSKSVGFEAFIPVKNLKFNKENISIVLRDDATNQIIVRKLTELQ